MTQAGSRIGKSVVVGGGGFIGRNLVRRLLNAGLEVEVFGRPPRPDMFNADSNLHWTRGELSDRAALNKVLAQSTHVYHLAGAADPRKFIDQAEMEVSKYLLPTLGLLDCCVEADVRSFVLVSSGGAVYGPDVFVPTPETSIPAPITAYGAGRLAAEAFLSYYRQYKGLQARVARISNPFGPWQMPGRGQGFVASCIDAALSGSPINIWGDGSIVRDFVFIDDVADGLMRLANYEGTEWLFNLGAGEGRKILDVAKEISALTGQSLEINFKHAEKADLPASILDISRAQVLLDWNPEVSWDEGLSRTIAWQRSLSRGEVG